VSRASPWASARRGASSRGVDIIHEPGIAPPKGVLIRPATFSVGSASRSNSLRFRASSMDFTNDRLVSDRRKSQGSYRRILVTERRCFVRTGRRSCRPESRLIGASSRFVAAKASSPKHSCPLRPKTTPSCRNVSLMRLAQGAIMERLSGRAWALLFPIHGSDLVVRCPI
jgi:hypothetical protein